MLRGPFLGLLGLVFCATVAAQEQAPGTPTAPAPDEAAPAKDVAAPAPPDAPSQEAAAPANAEAAPTQNETAPVNDTVAPPVEEPAPPVKAEAAPASVETPAAPAKDEAAPVTTEADPAKVENIPATDAVAPAPAAVETPVAPAQEEVAPAPPAAPAQAADPGVAIDRFKFSYGLDHPALPPLDELKALTIQSTRDGNVFRAPAASGAENLTLNAIPEGSRFDGVVLKGIAEDVVRWYNRRGLFGVWVAYTDLETSATGLIDNRAADNRAAHLVIWASQIAEVRTLARGKRVKPQFSINNRKHRGIISHSPLHPGENPEQPGSLFNEDVLNAYLHGLSLHPGRRVEASIASAGQPGKVVLDYLVNESKSWQIFSQVNNYGTEATGEFRGRIGFQHNQLTNHDDIFNVDAISTPDAKTYGSFISYRIPVFRPARLLVRVYGSYGDFLANDATLENLRFAGKNWLGGIELSNQLTLWKEWQLVTVLGANYNHYGIQSIISNTPLVTGFSNFLVPFLGTTLSREAGAWAVSGGVKIDHTVGDLANKDTTTGIPALGRLGADSDWTSARWNLNASIYLESLFNRSAKVAMQAHELTLRTKGRVLLRGTRLIPHEQEPMGGALSIRGYPESILSADEFIAATVEYAYHIPRTLKPGEPGNLWRWPFKWRPQKAGQNPDWDLVVRAFFDYGYRQVSPVPSDEPVTDVPLVDRNLTMAGAGVGVGLIVRQNFTLRCDYGTAFTELRDTTRPEEQQLVMAKGNKQFYFVSSFSW